MQIVLFQLFNGREYPPEAVVNDIDSLIREYERVTRGKHAIAGVAMARSYKATVSVDALSQGYTGEHLRAVLSHALGIGL